MDKQKLREELAALCHEQWSGWMDYLFGKCRENDMPMSMDGLVIPKEFVERWRRQVSTKYAELSEQEKDSDRTEADKFLDILEKEGILQGDNDWK